MQFLHFKRSHLSHQITDPCTLTGVDWWPGREYSDKVSIGLVHQTAEYTGQSRSAGPSLRQHAYLEMSHEEADQLIAALLAARARRQVHETVDTTSERVISNDIYLHAEVLGEILDAQVQQTLAQWLPSQTQDAVNERATETQHAKYAKH
jgi:hypothetical protein